MMSRLSKNILCYYESLEGRSLLLYEEGKWIHLFVEMENSMWVKGSLHVETLLDFSIEAYKRFIKEYVEQIKDCEIYLDKEDKDEILGKIEIIRQYIKKLETCKRKLEETLKYFE